MGHYKVNPRAGLPLEAARSRRELNINKTHTGKTQTVQVRGQVASHKPRGTKLLEGLVTSAPHGQVATFK
jgi:hypothetical protein